jgi:hypothetical protein
MRPALAARARRVAERRALGLKSPGGRPRGRWAWKAKDETEVLVRKAEDVIESLPAAPTDRPIEQWTLSEILNDNVRKYLTQSNAILSQHIKLRLSEADPELTPADIRQHRVIAEIGQGQAKLLANLQQNALSEVKQDRGWDELLARLAESQKKSRGGDKQ